MIPPQKTAPVDPNVPTGRWTPLDSRVITADRVVGWIVAGVVSSVLFVGVGALHLWVLLSTWASIGITVAAIVIALGFMVLARVWPPVEYRRTFYRVDELGVEICRGVVFRRLIAVPRSRLQHTDISEGPIERRYGLATLVLHTAGSVNSSISLRGLDRGTALHLREALSPETEHDAV